MMTTHFVNAGSHISREHESHSTMNNRLALATQALSSGEMDSRYQKQNDLPFASDALTLNDHNNQSESNLHQLEFAQKSDEMQIQQETDEQAGQDADQKEQETELDTNIELTELKPAVMNDSLGNQATGQIKTDLKDAALLSGLSDSLVGGKHLKSRQHHSEEMITTSGAMLSESRMQGVQVASAATILGTASQKIEFMQSLAARLAAISSSASNVVGGQRFNLRLSEGAFAGLELKCHFEGQTLRLEVVGRREAVNLFETNREALQVPLERLGLKVEWSLSAKAVDLKSSEVVEHLNPDQERHKRTPREDMLEEDD